MANQYRCHLLDKERVAAIIIAADDDAAAVLQADKILERTSCPAAKFGVEIAGFRLSAERVQPPEFRQHA
jgi:hypothetical protein